MKIKKIIMSIFSIIIVGILVACGASSDSGDSEEGVVLDVLWNWNGSSSGAPEDSMHNAVADEIYKETGVRMDITYATSSEVETLNNRLSTGEYPDVYVGPAWGTEASLMLDAANQGLLYDLSPYLEEYPRLAELVKEENMNPLFYRDTISKQEGGQFLLHSKYPATEEDIKDWLYGLYINEDIAEAVDIDPQSVKTPDDLYNLLKAIQEENLEINGNTIFPMGTYDNGWPLDITSEMFVPVAGPGSWTIDDNANVDYNFMTDEYIEWVLFIRKLMNENLIDPEIYTQSGTIAKEKVAQGRYAVLPNQFDGLWTDTSTGGIQDKFVPVGPLEDFEGNPSRTEVGVQGSELIAVFKSAGDEKLEAFVEMFDYLTSDEGFILAHYGIEGEHHDVVDGEIVAKEEMVEKLEDNTLKEEGIGTVYENLTGFDRTQSLGGGTFGHQFDPKAEKEQEVQEILRPNGIQAAEGLDPHSIYLEHPAYEQIDPVTITIGDVVQQAIMAPSDEEAMNIIEETQEALRNAGIEEVEDEISNQIENGTEMMQYRTSN